MLGSAVEGVVMISDSSPNLDTKYPDYPDFFDVGKLSIALIGPDETLR
jgi:hypothetical protein